MWWKSKINDFEKSLVILPNPAWQVTTTGFISQVIQFMEIIKTQTEVDYWDWDLSVTLSQLFPWKGSELPMTQETRICSLNINFSLLQWKLVCFYDVNKKKLANQKMKLPPSFFKLYTIIGHLMNIYDLNSFKAISLPIAHSPHNIASLYITRVGTRKYNQLVQGYVTFCSYTVEYPEKTSRNWDY